MIQECGIMDGCKQNKVYRLPHHFLLPQATLNLLCSLIFLFIPLYMGAISQAMLCRLDREKGILALVVTIISCPPPPAPSPPDHICQVYYSRTSIIQTIKISNHRKLHEHWRGLPCRYLYHLKGQLPTTIAKMHSHLWNSKWLSFSIQVKALV